MAILLSAAPPPVDVAVRQLLPDNDANFTATLGNWAPSGGALVRDTAVKLDTLVASAKFSPTTGAHYAELTIPGTFKAGVPYVFVIVTRCSVAGDLYTFQFGKIGTDSVSFGSDFSDSTESRSQFLRWTPSADRTGVSARWVNSGGAADDVWIMAARLYQAPEPPPVRVGLNTFLPAAVTGGSSQRHLGENSHTGIEFNGYAVGLRAGGSDKAGLMLVAPPTFDGSLYGWTEHAPGDVPDVGFNMEVGTDYVGFTVGERDASTVQFYADTSGGYMMQLRDRGSGKGWAVSRDGTVNGRVEDSFQWAFYVAGAQTVGADKAAHFQTPAKALIEEVRVHLGTAPTGATFIVDVNDDGTTIFTTQANRPTVAISGSNATSGVPDGGTAVAKDSVLTVDVDQVGSTIAGSDLVVFVRGRLIW